MSNRKSDPPSEIIFRPWHRGIYRGSSYEGFPQDYSPDCNNMMPWDPTARQLPSKRFGTSKYFGTTQFGGGAKFCQHMSQAVACNASGVTTAYIMLVFNRRTYRMKQSDTSVQAIDGGSNLWNAGRIVDMATFQNYTYMTDGTNAPQKFDHVAGVTTAAWTASGGGVFPSSGGTYPRGLCVWRGRMVAVRVDANNSSTVYFSAQNDPTNWDYAPTLPTPAQAIATNSNYRAGQMGDPVTALMPLGNDYLYLGLDHSIYRFVGDPGDGGSLEPVSESVGVLSKYAWCEVNGSLYFLGTGGLYKLTPGMEPRNLTQFAYNLNLENLPQTGYYTSVVYDRDRHAVLVFIAKQLTPWTTYNFLYDLRTETISQPGGIFPFSFPANSGGDDELGGTTAPTFGPNRAITFDGFDSTTNDRCVLIGCRDGYVRRLDNATLNDDGSAISWYGWSGPEQPFGPYGEGMINGHYPVLGQQSNTNVTWGIYTGSDAYTAMNASAAATGTFTTAGRQSPRGDRIAGNTFLLKLSDATVSKTGAFDQWRARLMQGGMNR